MNQLGTYEDPIIIPDDNEIQIYQATQELAPREGATVINRPEYFLTQHNPNSQSYNVYTHQDAYALLVTLLPRQLLEPLLYVLELFTGFFT